MTNKIEVVNFDKKCPTNDFDFRNVTLAYQLYAAATYGNFKDFHSKRDTRPAWRLMRERWTLIRATLKGV